MKNTYKILAIVPARAGSKRLPGKNKKLLAGKELIRYAIEAALDSQLITDLAVSSDDTDIINIANGYSGVYALKRPAEIAGDNAPAISYVYDALLQLNKKYDFIVIIQPTSPFTLASDIDGTIELLMNTMEADSSVSVVKLDHAIHPAKLKVMERNELKPYVEEENGRMAAHELPELFIRNCSVYVCRSENISNGYIIGEKCLGFIMPRERSIDINDPIDFEFAEFIKNKYG